ncbi:hypothetical protein QTO34_000265 [Cnephaeus nilssonii]|uniref:Peptidase A2 domain-containing protein n=1 Tax=Cnephaeus nilssonii TaxID=3371016 RepID=A0AA40LWR0_CNENI|nr:hypothetical protein QTO34_000265 [Eptesicus nilssonii]
MVDLLETIFQTQKPTWVDCKQLLFTFFNTEECIRVVSETRKWLQSQAPAGILDTDRWAREAFPDEEPDWNLNLVDGRAGLERYQLAFLQGLGPHEPMVRMKIGGQTVDLMVDMGAKHSVVTQKIAPFSRKEVTIIGATGDQTRRPFCCLHQCQLGVHQVIHEFLYLPDCPAPLMGRELLAKMGAEITFAPDGSA